MSFIITILPLTNSNEYFFLISLQVIKTLSRYKKSISDVGGAILVSTFINNYIGGHGGV